MAVIFEQTGFLIKAEEHYLKAIQTDPSYLPPYLNLGYLYQNSGHLDRAFEYFKLRYELAEPGDPWGEKAKQALLQIRPEYKKKFLYEEVALLNQELSDRAVRQFSDTVERSQKHFERGETYFEQEEYQRALTEFELALQLTPQNPKLIKARKKVILELSKQDIKDKTQRAINMLNSGDSISAKREIQRLLTTIPNESILNSK